eukprot:2420450-Pyramimonas_sp.AAC.1
MASCSAQSFSVVRLRIVRDDRSGTWLRKGQYGGTPLRWGCGLLSNAPGAPDASRAPNVPFPRHAACATRGRAPGWP